MNLRIQACNLAIMWPHIVIDKRPSGSQYSGTIRLYHRVIQALVESKSPVIGPVVTGASAMAEAIVLFRTAMLDALAQRLR